MNREVQDSEIQKRVELVRLKARQVGNMEPESPGLVDAAAQDMLSKLIPAREQVALEAIEVDRLPAPVDPNAYSESLTGMLSTLEAELAKENELVFPPVDVITERVVSNEIDIELPDTSGIEGEIDQRIANEEASGFVQVANRERLSLVERVIQQESGGDPNAVNPYSNASGIMQVMEATAAQPGFGVTPLAWEDRFNSDLNRAFGTEYLNAMLKRYDGDEEAALIAYNAGFTRADKWLAAGRDYEQFWWTEDKDGNQIKGWAQESQPYAAAIMGNNTLAPERPAGYGDVVYSVEDVTANVSQIAEVEAGIAGSELAQVGVQIPGLTQSDSVHRFTYPRAGQGMLDGIDTSYLPTEAATTPTETFYDAPVSDSEAVHPGSYKSVGEFVIDLKSRWPALRELMVDAAAWAAGPEDTGPGRAAYPGSYETAEEFASDLTQRWPEWREELVRLADIAAGPGETDTTPGRPAYPGSFENMAEFGAELKARWPDLQASLMDLVSAVAGRDLTEEVTGEAAAPAEVDAPAEAAESLQRSNWAPTYTADVMAHHAAAQGLKDMAFLPPVQLALERMPSDSFLSWSDATRGRDPLHREQAELALSLAGYEPRDWLGEEKPSDRFFNAYAYARMDGGNLSDRARSNAGEGPLRQVLAAARRMVFNR